MKLLSKTAFAINGFLIAGLLTACQTENGVTPSGPSTTIPETNTPVNNTGNLSNRINHQLIKHGSKKLLYNNDNQVGKIVDSPSEYTEYSYNNNAIAGTITALHYKNGQVSSKITYVIDPTGRCIKSVNSTENKTYKYEYNGQGQLVKRYNENAVNDRYEFDYNANGELSALRTFDSGNMKGYEVLFGYSVPNEAVQLDRYRLNSSFLYPMDEYLPIFGKFNTNLVRRITYKACGNNDVVEYLLNYELNSDGLVTEKSLINMGTNALVAKTPLVYSGYVLIPN